MNELNGSNEWKRTSSKSFDASSDRCKACMRVYSRLVLFNSIKREKSDSKKSSMTGNSCNVDIVIVKESSLAYCYHHGVKKMFVGAVWQIICLIWTQLLLTNSSTLNFVYHDTNISQPKLTHSLTDSIFTCGLTEPIRSSRLQLNLY